MNLRAVVFAVVGAMGLSGCMLPTQVAGGVTLVVPHDGPVIVTPEVRTGFHPLQLVEELQDRPADVGAGVVLRWEHVGTPAVSPLTEIYVEGTGIELDHEPGHTEYARRSYGADVTFWPGKKARVGGEAIVKQELAIFLHENREKTYAHGEMAIGLYAGLAVDSKKLTLSAGAFTRLPFAVTLDLPDRM